MICLIFVRTKMNHLRHLFIVILFSSFSLPSIAHQGFQNGMQGYIVAGKVLDSATKTPVQFASASLISVITGKPVDGKLTDSTGKIFFIVQNKGAYKLSVTAVGYGNFDSKTFVINDSNRFLQFGEILLPNHTVAIKQAEITVQGPLIENKVDKLVYNASQDISSKGGSATDLLRKVPMVEVDMDGNVSIRGSRNLRVLINGKPSALMANSVSDALRTIPSDQIDKVEVITNPGAKYDAEGTAGIINIIMKESRMKGTNGSMHAGAGNRSGNLGASISTQYGNTGFSVRLGGYFWRNIGEGLTQRFNVVPAGEFELQQKSANRVFGGGPFASLGFDHSFNKKNSISVAGTLRGGWNKNRSNWDTDTGISSLPLTYLYGRNTDNFSLNLGFDITADYRKTFAKKDREWGISAQYSRSSQSSDYDAVEVNASDIETYREKSNNLGLNHEYTIQTDFTEPIGKKLILESGLKTIIRNVSSIYTFDSFNFNTENYDGISSRNNDFYYNQNVYGGYAQSTWALNSNYSIRAGGRYEFTTYGGGRKDSGISFTGNPYGNFIPFLSINRKFGYSGFLRAGYTQRLLRPSMFYLNPYTNFSDPRNLTTGNPYLQAEVANNFELSAGNYTMAGGGSVTMYHRRTTNAIETIRNVDSLGVYRTTYGNIGLNYTTGMDVNVNMKGKKYMVNFNGGIGYVKISSTQAVGAASGLSNAGFTYSAGLWGNYKFATNWTVEAFARINAPTFSLQGKVQNWYYHSIGIKRRFSNDKGGIGLGIDNLFTPHVYYNTEQSGKDFRFYDRREINMLGIRINLDYKFGKVEFQQPKKSGKGIKNDDLKQGDSQQGQGQ